MNTERTRETIDRAVMHECRDCTRQNRRAGAKGPAARHVWRQDWQLTRTRVRTMQGTKFFDVVWSQNGTAVSTIGGLPHVRCPACGGANVSGFVIVGRVSAHECDARCTGAKGHDCECSCGGKNHGRDHMPVSG